MLNKRNIIILAILIISSIALIIKFLNSEKESNFIDKLKSFSQEEINRIEIKTPDEADILKFKKIDDKWVLHAKGKEYNADAARLKTIMDELNGKNIIRVAGKSYESRKKYKTDDSQGTSLALYVNDKLVQKLSIGSFDFVQDKNSPKAQYGRPQGETLTYLSQGESDMVYAINSMIALQLGKKLNDFRDKSLLDLKSEEILSVSINKDDNNLTLKKDNNWTLNGKAADSTLVSRYLNAISKSRGNAFADENIKPETKIAELNIKLKNNIYKVEAFANDSNSVLLRSNQFEKNVFLDKNNSLYNRLFFKEDKFESNK